MIVLIKMCVFLEQLIVRDTENNLFIRATADESEVILFIIFFSFQQESELTTSFHNSHESDPLVRSPSTKKSIFNIQENIKRHMDLQPEQQEFERRAFDAYVLSSSEKVI